MHSQYTAQFSLNERFLLKTLVNKDTATRREMSVYTLSSRWCILLNLVYSAHKNVTLCYL